MSRLMPRIKIYESNLSDNVVKELDTWQELVKYNKTNPTHGDCIEVDGMLMYGWDEVEMALCSI